MAIANVTCVTFCN